MYGADYKDAFVGFSLKTLLGKSMISSASFTTTTGFKSG
jgi:hypothetical protein